MIQRYSELHRRRGSRCRWSAARVVCDNITRNIQPNVCSVHNVTWRSGDLHDQLLITLQPKSLVLLQVCG